MTSDTGGDEHGMLTLQQAADHLGVHYMTAYRYVRTGQLRATRRRGRWSVAPADLTALTRHREQRSGADVAADGSSPADGDDIDRQRARLLERMLAGDEPGAWHIVQSPPGGPLPPDRVHLELLAPCLREIGRRWAAGTLDVGDEHVATATAARLAARLAPLRARRGRTRGTIVLCGAPDERHGLPMTLLTNVLRSRGWGVIELGPDTPAIAVVTTARRADRLLAVAVSIGSAEGFGSATDMLAELRRSLPGVPLLVGGPGVPDAPTARRLGGDGWGADAEEVDHLLAVERVRRRDPPAPPPPAR
jgi:MerR family transcriptional regulator, light-induced transcriptional regulator